MSYLVLLNICLSTSICTFRDPSKTFTLSHTEFFFVKFIALFQFHVIVISHWLLAPLLHTSCSDNTHIVFTVFYGIFWVLPFLNILCLVFNVLKRCFWLWNYFCLQNVSVWRDLLSSQNSLYSERHSMSLHDCISDDVSIKKRNKGSGFLKGQMFNKHSWLVPIPYWGFKAFHLYYKLIRLFTFMKYSGSDKIYFEEH